MKSKTVVSWKLLALLSICAGIAGFMGQLRVDYVTEPLCRHGVATPDIEREIIKGLIGGIVGTMIFGAPVVWKFKNRPLDDPKAYWCFLISMLFGMALAGSLIGDLLLYLVGK